MKVYNNYAKEVVFTGSPFECAEWVFGQAWTLANGNKFYRYWEIDGQHIYDIGPAVYSASEELAKYIKKDID